MNNAILRSALTNPINLMMLALAVAAGLCSSWVLFLVGIGFWALMVYVQTRDPAARLQQSLDERQALAFRFQQRYDRIEKNQIRIFNAIQSSKPPYQKALGSVNDAVNKLSLEAYNLCERMTVLENHRLITQSKSELDASLAEVSGKIDKAQDPVVKAEYEESLRSIQAKLESDKQVNLLLERTEAQLSNVANDLDRVLTDVIQCLSLSPEQAELRLPEILGIINTEYDQLIEHQANATKF
jgi:hypothetical protein